MTRAVVPVAPIDLLANVIVGNAESTSLAGLGLRGLAPLVASLGADPSELRPPPRSEIGAPESTRTEARRLATTHLVVQETADRALAVLHKAGHHPVLLKGLAMSCFYPRGHLRPTGDVDLLVHPEHFADARAALIAAGWQSVVSGRWAEHYLAREGYCWQALRPNESVLELHFHLWGSVAPEYGAAVVDSADVIEGRRRPCPEDLVVIAASHAWRQPSPRRGVDFVDVALVLSREAGFDFDRLQNRLNLSGQHLPVALCLRTLGESVPAAATEWLVRGLLPQLHGSERRLYRRTQSKDPDQISWPSIRLAMLRAGRPSRIGWWAIWRRVWPHPVALAPRAEGPPLWVRRLLHSARRRG